MGEFITNIFNAFLELMRQFRAVDVLDIVVVAFLIYSLIKLVRETRAEQLVKGLLIMIIAWALSSQLNLKMIKTLLDNFFQFGIIALLVVFQPELAVRWSISAVPKSAPEPSVSLRKANLFCSRSGNASTRS